MKMKEKIISITNIIKSKALPFLLIFCLVFHFSSGVSFATAFTYSDENKTFGPNTFDSSLWTILYSYMESQVDFNDFDSCLICYDPHSSNNGVGYICVTLCSDPILDCGGIGSIYTGFPDSSARYFAITDYSYNPYSYSYSSSSLEGTLYKYGPLSGGSWSSPAYSDGYIWCSSSLKGYDPNLLFRDTRFLSAEKVSRYNVDYLEIVTNDLDFGGDSFVTLTGLVGSTPFSQTFGLSSFSGVAADNPYTYFYINPLLISYDSFIISSVEYENRYGSYGSKTISTVIDFGTPTSDVPLNYDVNTTINSFTQFVDEGSVSYGLDTLYLGSDSISGHHFYWSSSDVPTRQKWELKALFIPNPSFLQHYTGQDSLSSSTAYQIFEQFDLIVFNVDNDAFDYIYGSGQFSILDNITTGLDFDLLVKKCVELSTDYSNLRMDELAPTTILYSDSDCGFVFTRSYLLKKMYFFMGDIDTRLLEFETNLVSENGVLAAVQTKLANIVTNNSSFFDLALEDLTNIVYFCNDISLNGYLPAMVSSLGSIDSKLSLLNYLTSIDNKLGLIDLSNLSYLTNLSSIAAANSSMASDLTYISTDSANIWDSIDGYFPNFYDYLFDIKYNTDEIISILYDMHETVIVDMDLPTIIFNDGDLVDFGNWINDWIVVLPEFDFSEFPNFFTNANNLVTDLAGQNDDLIGSLDDPYTYSDSEVHSLGWD